MRDSLSKMFANVVTILNIVFGTLSIIYILADDFRMAALLILVAAVMDGADGKIARRLDSTSELGKELDSLCDLVSFGVAPAILLFAQVLHGLFPTLGVLCCILFVVCGALRLARFNILNIHEYFLGIPITIAGLLLAIVSLLAAYISPGVILLLVFVLSLLMVSNIRIPKIGA